MTKSTAAKLTECIAQARIWAATVDHAAQYCPSRHNAHNYLDDAECLLRDHVAPTEQGPYLAEIAEIIDIVWPERAAA